MREIVYKVKGTSNVKSLAGCIAKSIKGEGETKASDVVLLCCGAQSLILLAIHPAKDFTLLVPFTLYTISLTLFLTFLYILR